MAGIPYRSSFRAIGSSELTGALRAMAGASTARPGCSITKAPAPRRSLCLAPELWRLNALAPELWRLNLEPAPDDPRAWTGGGNRH